ncbi:MAG: RdgB/HAM1 family non-canonical purine NTP pyrophosphatase [Candidatus Thorarchaeota archaeon]|nr:RdgB/HAM1 family non-canonical purine NTP pyrophosphatase [Candidatus Thorarchaeota archaeon]
MSKDKVTLVTQNENKIAELAPIFEEYDVPFETTNLQKHEIRSQSVGYVALEAAIRAFDTLKRPVVVDDTGLYIEHLNEFPGAYAAYVLETIGVEGILRLMEDATDRDARFDTSVGYCNGRISRYFIGTMYGDIAASATGKGGFGYDPIFIPENETRTYAELSLDEKIAISHRSQAFRKFLDWYVE